MLSVDESLRFPETLGERLPQTARRCQGHRGGTPGL